MKLKSKRFLFSAGCGYRVETLRGETFVGRFLGRYEPNVFGLVGRRGRRKTQHLEIFELADGTWASLTKSEIAKAWLVDAVTDLFL